MGRHSPQDSPIDPDDEEQDPDPDAMESNWLREKLGRSYQVRGLLSFSVGGKHRDR